MGLGENGSELQYPTFVCGVGVVCVLNLMRSIATRGWGGAPFSAFRLYLFSI